MKKDRPDVKGKTPIADQYAQRINKIAARLGNVPFPGGSAPEAVVEQLRHVSPYIEKGEEQVQNLDMGREISAVKRKERKEQLRQDRRQFAFTEWPKHPEFSRSEMAGHIRFETSDPDAIPTIENDIKGIKARVLRHKPHKTE